MAALFLVDSDEQSRQAVRCVIEESPYKYLAVHEADSAHRAGLLLKQMQPTIMILDLSLPDMNGVSLGKMAKGLYPQLPIVVLSHLKMFDLVQECINAGFSSYLLKPISKHELMAAFDRLLLSELCRETRHFMGEGAAPATFETDLGNPIDTVIRYIQLNFQQTITLQEVSSLVYLSPSHFSRLFKAETGITFVEYLTQYRIEKSKSLLKMTSLPIDVIANNTGFSSAGYFSTTFKRMVGQTPSEYRSQFQVFLHGQQHSAHRA